MFRENTASPPGCSARATDYIVDLPQMISTFSAHC